MSYLGSLDPSAKLNKLDDMTPEEMSYARMEASNAADAVLGRYRSKGPRFVKLVASFLKEKADKLISDSKSGGAI